ncbi:hypothetical protein [Actinomadura mexicana]|uniref:Uncharacterized protein n=1 Tax=Actinomadura mexicana TaxID=134959 RepID=A0A238VLM2_9ACTN|nr:hypothetical protein [Actinomadura mexicana]SNR35017.1 hypothetical protein SAMN06265355_10211 [Actinomadura mexicana]
MQNIDKGRLLYDQRNGRGPFDETAVNTEAERIEGSGIARGGTLYRARHGQDEDGRVARLALGRIEAGSDEPTEVTPGPPAA